MTVIKNSVRKSPMALRAWTAADFMTSNPVSIREEATIADAAAFLTSRGFSAAPVINEAGRPVGVISRTDLLRRRDGEQSLDAEALVRDVMTPLVFSIATDTSAAAVVAKMLALAVRRLFVVDEANVLVGVISGVDILRALRPTGSQTRTAAG